MHVLSLFPLTILLNYHSVRGHQRYGYEDLQCHSLVESNRFLQEDIRHSVVEEVKAEVLWDYIV